MGAPHHWGNPHLPQQLVGSRGVELGYYGTGNICYAELDGKKVSNNTGKSLKAMKAWIDADSEVHVKINDRARFYIKEATLIERIKEALKEDK